jgi:hypothetical protein
MIVERRGSDRDGGYLITLKCGHVDIGGAVCYGVVAVIDEPVSFPDVLPRIFILHAPTGFAKGDDGVWYQIEHARKNQRDGRPVAYRRPWKGTRNIYALRRVEYPYVVQCPWCPEMHTIVDEDALRALVDK